MGLTHSGSSMAVRNLPTRRNSKRNYRCSAASPGPRSHRRLPHHPELSSSLPCGQRKPQTRSSERAIDLLPHVAPRLASGLPPEVARIASLGSPRTMPGCQRPTLHHAWRTKELSSCQARSSVSIPSPRMGTSSWGTMPLPVQCGNVAISDWYVGASLLKYRLAPPVAKHRHEHTAFRASRHEN